MFRWRPGKIYDDDNIGWCFTYFFTEIFPTLSTCMQSLVCAFCRKFVAEPLSSERLYANFISSSVQCCNETRIWRKRVLLFCFYAYTFWFCFIFMTLKCFIRAVKGALHLPSAWKRFFLLLFFQENPSFLFKLISCVDRCMLTCPSSDLVNRPQKHRLLALVFT